MTLERIAFLPFASSDDLEKATAVGAVGVAERAAVDDKLAELDRELAALRRQIAKRKEDLNVVLAKHDARIERQRRAVADAEAVWESFQN